MFAFEVDLLIFGIGLPQGVTCHLPELTAFQGQLSH
jgi:hypothetical protein